MNTHPVLHYSLLNEQPNKHLMSVYWLTSKTPLQHTKPQVPASVALVSSDAGVVLALAGFTLTMLSLLATVSQTMPIRRGEGKDRF